MGSLLRCWSRICFVRLSASSSLLQNGQANRVLTGSAVSLVIGAIAVAELDREPAALVDTGENADL